MFEKTVDEQFVEKYGTDLLSDFRAYQELLNTAVIEEAGDRHVTLLDVADAWTERAESLEEHIAERKARYVAENRMTWSGNPEHAPAGPSQARLDWGFLCKLTGRLNSIHKTWLNVNRLKAVQALLNEGNA